MKALLDILKNNPRYRERFKSTLQKGSLKNQAYVNGKRVDDDKLYDHIMKHLKEDDLYTLCRLYIWIEEKDLPAIQGFIYIEVKGARSTPELDWPPED